MSEQHPGAAGRSKALEHYVGISRDSSSLSWGAVEAKFHEGVYAPIATDLIQEIIVGMVHKAVEEVAPDYKAATFEQLDEMAFFIGLGVLQAYNELAKELKAAGESDE